MPSPTRIRLISCLWIFALAVFCQSASASDEHSAEKLTLRQHIEASSGAYPLTAFGVVLRTQSVLERFYLERNFVLGWHDVDLQLTSQAREMIEVIGSIAGDGLLPSDYHDELLRQHAAVTEGSHETADAVELDLLLSDAVITLSQHLSMGKVDPETLSTDWKANRRSRDLALELGHLMQADDVAARLDDFRPHQVRYFRLKKLLAELRSREVPVWGPLAVSPALKPGDTDARVSTIRQRLAYWADLQPDTTLQIDEDRYDEALVAAVKSFQRRHGLDEDGVLGKLSFEALNVSPAQREQQIVTNLERWRWLADDLGEKHVLVNIAAFELKVIDNNETAMRKPVIVGRDYRRTPVFSGKIGYLVLNPTWTAPNKLAVKDLLPAIRKDPDYFSRLGITVFDRSQNSVDPATVDWAAVSTRNFPYRFVQSPGPLNAMGQVKFMFPNNFDVYLHDTPSRDLFTKTDRAFSSGCVRVFEPLDLAAWLLKDSGMNREKIDAIVAKGEFQTVFLKKSIPVHIEYWTAWVDRDGEINFRKDLYQRDSPLSAALAAPL